MVQKSVLLASRPFEAGLLWSARGRRHIIGGERLGGKLDRNQQLDGLRGFAALAVAVHHTLLEMGQPKALDLWYATIQSLGDGVFYRDEDCPDSVPG